jgi:hypothetical protein
MFWFTPMLHKKDGKRLANPYGCKSYNALKHFARNKPMVNLRIGSISGHLFSPAKKPEDSRSVVAKGLQ